MVTENKNKGFADRFNEKLNEAGAPDWSEGRQQWVATKFGVSTTAARKWMMAEGMPRTDKLQDMARKLNTTFEYLISGNGDAVRESGPIYRSDRQDIHQLIDRLPPRLLTKARAALEFFVVEDPELAQVKTKKKKT
jgi:transcriptional regulator with XRE-family HTH domain